MKAVADASGLTPGEYALQVLEQAIADDWAEDERRFADYERTGQSVSLDEWMGGLRAEIAARRAG